MIWKPLKLFPPVRLLARTWSSPFFPWRLFFEFILRQTILIILFSAFFGMIASAYFHQQAGDFMLVSEMLPVFNKTLFLLILCLVLVFVLVSLWMSRRLMIPIGGLLRRMDRTVGKSEAFSAQDLQEEEPGELSDLATAIETMRKDLIGKEERLAMDQTEAEALMSSVGDAILAIDINETSLYYNSQFAVLFGTGSRGQTRFKIGEVFRSPEILGVFQKTLRLGEPQSATTQHFLGYDRITRYFQLSVTPLRKKNSSSAYGALGIFHDVSELKRAEQIRIEFVGNVSHELRTPLTAIKGYTDTLKQDIQDGQTEFLGKYASVIQTNVDRLMSLVNDLLDLSSLESGYEVHREEVSCREITEKALVQLEPKRLEKQHLIVATFQTETLFADPKRVEQVIVNLTENAIKYIPNGRRIDIIWEPAANNATVLRVKDNGPGIPKMHQERLFERFYRVDYDRNSQTGGTGLGLAIVKHILQRHSGFVKVQSGPGQGTEFICHFPE